MSSCHSAGLPPLPRLKKLEADGVEMVACRTCLDYLACAIVSKSVAQAPWNK